MGGCGLLVCFPIMNIEIIIFFSLENNAFSFGNTHFCALSHYSLSLKRSLYYTVGQKQPRTTTTTILIILRTMFSPKDEKAQSEQPDTATSSTVEEDGELGLLLQELETTTSSRPSTSSSTETTTNMTEPVITSTTTSSSSSNSNSTFHDSFGSLLHSQWEESIYGTTSTATTENYQNTARRMTPEQLKERMMIVPEKDDTTTITTGLIWNATLIPNQFLENRGTTTSSSSTSRKGVFNPIRDLVQDANTIKPRRPTLPVTVNDFFSSLVPIIDDQTKNTRYIFHGVLNGWPGLRYLELIAIEQQRSTIIPTPKELMTGQIAWNTVWTQNNDNSNNNITTTTVHPQQAILKAPHKIHRAKLRGPPWTAKGWSPTSPGFAFWFEACCPRHDTSTTTTTPVVYYGNQMPTQLQDHPHSKCTYIHMCSHRYAKLRESVVRDKLTYHSIALLEWEHGQYTTVVETAYLNGMGGFCGKSNWYHDRDAPVTKLYECMPPEMILPWRSTSAEIRAYDVPARNLDEFQNFVQQYTGNTGRFLDPRFTFSHPARLTFRTKAHIAQYLVNYIGRDSSYAELKRNCQTFTADLCSFLAGKKDVVPFHPVSRIEYNNRNYLFLYDSEMYKSRKEKSRK